MKVSGQVIEIKNESGTSKTGNEWKKRTVIIQYTDNGNIKYIAGELFGENKIDANPVRKGQWVDAYLNVESKEYNGRWFTSCSIISLTKTEKGSNGVSDEVMEVKPIMYDLSDDSALPF
jgi:hypothetical protein